MRHSQSSPKGKVYSHKLTEKKESQQPTFKSQGTRKIANKAQSYQQKEDQSRNKWNREQKTVEKINKTRLVFEKTGKIDKLDTSQ